MIAWRSWGGRWRSPRRSGSGGWRRWRARWTGSMRGCWPSWGGSSWCRRSGCPIRRSGPSANGRAFGCIWVRHRVALKNRVHATLVTFGVPWAVSDLFGPRGRRLLDRLAVPDPWRSDVLAAVALIDEIDGRIDGCERELRRLGADHRYVPLLMTVPGIAWLLGYTIAAEIGDITRFASAKKLAGYTGPVPARLPIGCARPSRFAGQERAEVSALGADRGRDARRPAPRLPRPLPAHRPAPGQAARQEGRPDRDRPQALRSDLAHAHPQPAVRSGKSHVLRSGRMTAQN
jgi:Transposase IS116/IS110/IS902 family